MVLASAITKFSRQEISNLYKQARLIFRSPTIKVWRAPCTGKFARILIVIPRAVGNAVARNKLRRRIKNIFYELALFNEKYDYIVRAYSGSTHVPFSELKMLFSSFKTQP